MNKIVIQFLAGALLAGGLRAQTKSPVSWSDEDLWQDFAAWARAVEPLPPGETKISTELYERRLLDMDVSKNEADELMTRLQRYRRGSPERERIYWNVRFKLGGGPDQPLRLLAETVRHLQPGKALDVASGRGRNAIYLASIGWDVTAYDLSPEALKAAQRAAAEAGVKLHTVEATHETFDFGEKRWDLIVCSYAYMSPDQPEWPERLWAATAPGGTVVIQTSWNRQASLRELIDHWGRFRVLRYEDVDAGKIDGEWPPSKTNPTVKLVLRKDAN